ncbi:MAG TPA: hypothetical protein VKN76_18380 [Kiloniellaceae bacterium]|nr:hypothetical protein [Kiloniellaceae bacterium]
MAWKKIHFVVCCSSLLAACGSASSPAPTKVEQADQSGIAISAEFDAPNVRNIAQSHCAKYNKNAMVHDATPIGDTVNSGWVYGVKPYLFTYDCM